MGRRGGLALLLALAACSGQPELPAADELLRSAAEEMRGVSSVGFRLEVAGPLGALAIRRAEGVLTQEGDASAVVSLEQAGSLIEYEVVTSGATTYVKGPTGGFQEVPSIIANTLFDPTELLDPGGGVAGFLAQIDGGRTEAAEEVEGTPAYRVAARVRADTLEGLLPLELGEADVPSVAWIGAEVPVVVRLRVTVQLRGETDPTTLTVTLSDFNVPTSITPPPA